MYSDEKKHTRAKLCIPPQWLSFSNYTLLFCIAPGVDYLHPAAWSSTSDLGWLELVGTQRVEAVCAARAAHGVLRAVIF